MQLGTPPENIQETLNRRTGDHLETDIALPHRLLDRLKYAQHGRIAETKVSEVKANVGQMTAKQSLESLEKFSLIGEVELPPAFQDHGITHLDRLDGEIARVIGPHRTAPIRNSRPTNRGIAETSTNPNR